MKELTPLSSPTTFPLSPTQLSQSKAVEKETVSESNPAQNPRNSLSTADKVKRSRLDVLILLALGVTAHDIASIYGFHIPGLHAIDFSVPMILILLSVKWTRWLRNRRHK